MSTNKTEHHALHAWEPEDDFLLSEINQNFAAVDGVLPHSKRLRVAAGSYLGNDKSNRVIEVGFRPIAVVVTSKPNTTCPYSGICVDGAAANDLSITDGGFLVSGYFNRDHASDSGYVSGKTLNPYHYIALGWEE